MTPLNETARQQILKHTRQLVWFTLLVTLFSWSGATPVLFASGEAPAHENATMENGMTIRDVTQGSLLFRTHEAGRYIPAPLLKTDVKFSITGIIARATVTQEFLNPSRITDDWTEGIYVFPLPETAAVDRLRMKVGDRTIIGEIRERTDAKRHYEQAKQEGKRASLVEQERPNVFTVSIANIAPQDRITVEIEYQEAVRYDRGEFSLRFPMVVGPRYTPGRQIISQEPPQGHGWSLDTDRVSDASRVTPPVQRPDLGPINLVDLTVDLMAGFPISKVASPYHEILILEGTDDQQHISLRKDRVPANRDFVLTWKPVLDQEPTAAVYREVNGDDTYAFLMVMPPASGQTVAPVPREAIFVIDTSGSMAGTSIEQAKAALLLALTKLKAQDRFNVIQFNNNTHMLFAQPQPLTIQTLRKAVHYVEQLHANGGTEILPALKAALDGTPPSSHLRQIIFLTDGQVSNEQELFDVIHGQLGESRLFTIGIGSAPNSHFMRKASELGRGTFTHIGSTSEVQSHMDALLRKLEQPVLTNIRLEGLDETIDAVPTRMPDLYDGEPLVLAFKSPTLPASVTITGTFGSSEWSTTMALSDGLSRAGVSVYWARQKITSLMDERRLGKDDSMIRQTVAKLALTHHLVSPYTSLVAVDTEPIRPSHASLITHAMSTNLPEGQDYQAIFGLPRTATGAPVHLLIGLIALALPFWLWRLHYRFA